MINIDQYRQSVAVQDRNTLGQTGIGPGEYDLEGGYSRYCLEAECHKRQQISQNIIVNTCA